ncbi:outer membrane protein assembly factor BamA [Marispirochaeta aestuarii]|uniref:Outer membrane protein assembly factor BamA n=1 Tax=Marispirochaeta aestuarii TaxID=1963862 RepID=A0A1Y1S149_9SPIO|nr:outer membrane protein assembly factor BamA [Marispirochaeta aestuarii]ORC37228.1 outer membrane protein assembly factor BamA [Marispirochaeta aestuarii]
MRKTLLVFVLLILCLSAWTQEDNWWVGKPIEDIRFEGLLSVSEYDLEGITNQYIGEPFTDTLSWELQSKIFALDYFESYSIDAVEGSQGTDSVVIEFTVKERPLVDEIIINGNKNLRDSEILDTVLLKRDDMVTRNKVRLDAEAIRTLYIEKGYPDAEVSGRFEKNQEGRAVVYFDVNEGAQTRIKNIYFSGNSFVSDSTLKRRLETKEQGLFSSGIYQESTIEQDKRIILSYYWERGYVDAQIVEVRQTPTPEQEDEDRNYVDITFYIEEGSQYTYGGVEFQGNTLFTDEELQELIRQEKGAVLNRTALQADFTRVANLYFDDGYIFNQIDRREIRNEQERSISYVVEIVERGRAHIENIIIKGNTKTKDHVIEREIPLEVGDVFSREKIVQGLQNLYNTQYFSAVNPETPAGSVDNLMDLVINVEEGKTIDLNFGISFTGGITGFPMVGFINLADKNFLGRGQEISIGAEVSTQSQSIDLAFKENWLFGHRWYGGINFGFEHLLIDGAYQDLIAPNNIGAPDPYDSYEEYEWAIENGEGVNSDYLMEYDSYEASLGVSTGYTWNTWLGRIGLGTGLSTSLNYIWYDDEVYRPYSSDVRDNLETWLPITRLWTSLSFDTRDLIYNPSKGYYLNQRFTYTGGFLPSTRDYLRSTTTGDIYFTLLDTIIGKSYRFRSILGFHTEFAFILPQFNGDLAATDADLLYIDGMTVALGWPRVLGGQSRWDSRLNLTFPIFEQFLWFDNFASATVMYLRDENDPHLGLEEFRDMQLEDFKFTLGSGLKLTIPGIPLGFYFAKRFKILDDGIEWQPGPLFKDEDDPDSGLDFIIAFTMTM